MQAFTTAQILRGLDAISQTPTTERAPVKGWLDTWIGILRDIEVLESADGNGEIDSPEDSLKFVYDQGLITGFDCPTGYRLTVKGWKLMDEHGRLAP